MKNKITKRGTIRAIAATATVSLALPYLGAMDHKKAENSYEHDALRASSVEGMDIVSRDGMELGNIDDIVFSTETGDLDRFVVGTGFLGIGGPTRSVSVDTLDTPDLTSSSLKTSLRQKEFENSPEFMSESLRTNSVGDERLRTGQIEAMNYIYSDIESQDGAHLGEVIDWIVDVKHNNVPFVIVRQLDALVGTGYEYYAVSTDAIKGVRTGDIVATVTSDAFGEAPQLDEETALSRDSDAEIYRFTYSPGTEMGMK